MPNKERVRDALIRALEEQLQVAMRAADEARETATHADSVAENQYDTFGLEASYLAQGQSRRIEELRRSLAAFRNVPLPSYVRAGRPGLGALVTLENDSGEQRHFFLGPVAGGLRVSLEGVPVAVVTGASPLGSALLAAEPGDPVRLQGRDWTLSELV